MNPITPAGVRPASPPTTAAAGPADAADASAIQDVFAARRSVQSASMADLRRLTACMESRLNGPPAPHGKVNVEDIPFGIELEMEAEPRTWYFTKNQMRMAFDQAGFQPWNVHPKLRTWKIERDDSLTPGRSAESVSPVMNLHEPGVAKSKAEEEIERIYALAKSLHGHTTHKCGLHIHVDAKVLGEKGLSNLFRMCMENENLLFKLSQNGEPQHRGVMEGFGWRHNMKYYYSRPFSPFLKDAFPIMHASGASELGHSLYTMVPPSDDHPRPAVPPLEDFANFKPDRKDSVRYFGVNFNSYWFQGTIEFRLFNATDDPQQVLTDIKLVLGMVAAAAEGGYAYVRPQPLDVDNPNKPVPRETFEYFMNQVSRFPGVRQRFEQTFQQGGGSLVDDAPVNDPHILSAAQLLARGYRFRASGKDIVSPFEVVEQVQGHHRLVETFSPDSPTAQSVHDIADLKRLAHWKEAWGPKLSRMWDQAWRATTGVFHRSSKAPPNPPPAK